MKKLSIVTASALLVAGLSTAAFADNGGVFRNADANNDGMVSLSEAMGIYNTLTVSLFDSVDSNGDGLLDEGQFFELRGLSASFSN